MQNKVNFVPTSHEKWSAKNAQIPFSNIWKRESTKSISELHTDDNKSKYSSNPKYIFNLQKKVYERLYTKETTSKAATTNFFSKVPKRKKISNDRFNLYKAKISLNEIIKSIKSQTNSKSSGNDPLTT